MKIFLKTVDCVFIGYAHHSNAYHFVVHGSKNPDIHKGSIIESKSASFFEHVLPYKSKEDEPRSSNKDFENIVEISQEIDEESEDEMKSEDPRRGKRAWVEKSFESDFLTYLLARGRTSNYI